MRTIQVLGPGCAKCKTLHAHAEEAVRALGLDARVEKIEAIAEIMKYGLLTTPGLAVDGKVKSAGRVLTVDEIKRLIAP